MTTAYPQTTIDVQGILTDSIVCLTRALGLIYARYSEGMLLDMTQQYRAIWRAEFPVDWSKERSAVLSFSACVYESPSIRYCPKRLLLPKSNRELDSFTVALRVDSGLRDTHDPSTWISLYAKDNSIQRVAYDKAMQSDSLRAYKDNEVEGEIAEFIEDYLL